MEILYKPAKPTIEKINERSFTQRELNLQLEALQKNLDWLAANNGKQNIGNHAVDLVLLMRLQKTVATMQKCHGVAPVCCCLLCLVFLRVMRMVNSHSYVHT